MKELNDPIGSIKKLFNEQKYSFLSQPKPQNISKLRVDVFDKSSLTPTCRIGDLNQNLELGSGVGMGCGNPGWGSEWRSKVRIGRELET